MKYVHITIQLYDGGKRSGIRSFAEPLNLEDIRNHAWHLAAEVLGRQAIENVDVREVPVTDPSVVALILKNGRGKTGFVSDGKHPYLKEQQRKPLH